ncbi:hypothetical protein VIGAN_04084600 [Vigna angularis var. angularis]|uniref:Uncharacterized protein n=1 Tax=Vigna angularis var. angularis TaxID=157739 RepID=A0A0S3RSW1_PHAAN|nr:hypothetical protein VIGAN_04084600 [Vigna angularis var. angularis]
MLIQTAILQNTKPKGKSNKSCKAVSDESSMSLELEESDPRILHSNSCFTMLEGVVSCAMEAKSAFIPTDSHLLEDDPAERGLGQELVVVILLSSAL